MARLEVIWTVTAKRSISDILYYYFQRNGNNKYGSKLKMAILKSLDAIATFPQIGKVVNSEEVRSVVAGNYQIIYQIIEDRIVVLVIWDCRRDPEGKGY